EPGVAGKPVQAFPPPATRRLFLCSRVFRVTRLERHGFAFGTLHFHGDRERLAVLVELVGDRARSALRVHRGHELVAVPVRRDHASRVGRVRAPVQLALTTASVIDLKRIAFAEDHELLGLRLRTLMLATAWRAAGLFAGRRTAFAAFAPTPPPPPSAVRVSTPTTPPPTAPPATPPPMPHRTPPPRAPLGRILAVLFVEHPDAGEIGNLSRNLGDLRIFRVGSRREQRDHEQSDARDQRCPHDPPLGPIRFDEAAQFLLFGAFHRLSS